ncbi:MAG: DUF6159 family protein [Candidatus Micrarchaeota archaeon]
MLEGLKRSWDMTLKIVEIMKSDRELMLFPMASGFFMLLAIISFIIPLVALNLLHNLLLAVTALFLFYFVTYFIVIFFNSALVAAVNIRLEGKKPTLAEGMDIALGRIPSIVGWAVISATVGMVLRTLTSGDNKNFIGPLLASLLGASWSLMTFFVIPVLVIEGQDPLSAIKRSLDLWKSVLSSGQNIRNAGTIGIGGGALALAIFLVYLISIMALFYAVGMNSTLLIPALVVFLLLIAVTQVLLNTVNMIFVTMIYHYAVSGEDPENLQIEETIKQVR